MGGDHKCPVCQATFTRPQHVARHMRSRESHPIPSFPRYRFDVPSGAERWGVEAICMPTKFASPHSPVPSSCLPPFLPFIHLPSLHQYTGDRPYKCQHCGDQFARSDLLSRHVNKCHAAEKNLGGAPLIPGVAPGRRKGSTAATRATTSKQACDQCVQSSLPCDGSNPCAKCVSRKTRCTFVKFHRQTAPVGPGHPSSLAAAASHPSLGNPNASPSMPSASLASSPLGGLGGLSSGPGLHLTGGLGGVGVGVGPGGGGGPMALQHPGHPALSANSPHPLPLHAHAHSHLVAHQAGGQGPGPGQPFLYAQQVAGGGGGYSFTRDSLREMREGPGGGGGSSTSSPTSGYAEYDSGAYAAGAGGERRLGSRERDYYPQPPGSAPGSSSAGYYSEYRNEPFDARGEHSAFDARSERSFEYDRRSEHSGFDGRSEHGGFDGRSEHSGFDGRSEHSGSVGGSRPQSSGGPGGDYAPFLPNGHHASASIDLHELGRHHPDLRQRSEFSSAFGLMSLDDPNVLAGLAADGVPFFSQRAPGSSSSSSSHSHSHSHHSQAGHTGLTPGTGPGVGHTGLTPHGEKARAMQLVPPLAYQAYPPLGPPAGVGVGAQTPSTREAETRELREFWKAYMRTPLTGPGDVSALGLQTPSANAGAALAAGLGPPSASGRRYRVASLPSVKTPEGEMDAAPSYAAVHQPGQGGGGGGPQTQQARTMHNDDLRSYEAAVLARKAPELTLRKPARRPTTSAGVSQPQQQQQQQPPPSFDFGAAGRERGGALEGAGTSQSSLAGAFGFAGAGYGAAPAGSGSVPNSPFPGTPSSNSASASASASDDGDDEHSSRPAFKRLPSQTLGPPQSKRRRDRPTMEILGMMTPGASLGPGGALAGGGPPAGGAGGGTGGLERPPSVNAYPERPMIALRAPPAHPQRRARRLSAPASPTAPGFVID
ncbi:hypothetical protein B0H11DRAFT_2276488 [Mycena galericulata]|nr:hypothetical protein B0H11DRAFT_2276488 [Mycena galericulata]